MQIKMHFLKYLSLSFLIFVMLIACVDSKTQTCKNLIEVAENKNLMDKTWDNLQVFFDNSFKYDYGVAVKSIYINKHYQGFEDLDIEWGLLGLNDHDREIKLNYKDEFRNIILKQKNTIEKNMIVSIYVGEFSARLLFMLKQPEKTDNEADKEKLKYKLSVECNQRGLEAIKVPIG